MEDNYYGNKFIGARITLIDMIEIIPVGGYSEIGRNCTIVKYGGESIMLDFGLEMENYIKIAEDEDVPARISQGQLIRAEAVPDIGAIQEELQSIKAICISHAHLDHVGALPFFAEKLKAPVHGTRFTIEVLKALLADKKATISNKLITHPSNSRFRVSKNLEVQFIHVTHSTPQTVVVAIHTPEGTVVYANDFKLDNTPVLGKKPNYKEMEKLKNVRALIMDSLYAMEPRKTPSESIARQMLKDVMIDTSSRGRNIVVTTFSSHIERLKTITDMAKKLNRKPVFVGRSLGKYIDAAKKANIIDLEKNAEIVRFGSKVEKYFRKTRKTEDKLFIVTGHQGERKAVLARMAREGLFNFRPDDLVIFSCKIIPIEESYINREALENDLTKRKVRIFRDIHVSGHASREDHREFIKIIGPEHIIPTHGNPEMLAALKELAVQMGYNPDKVHIQKNFSRIYL